MKNNNNNDIVLKMERELVITDTMDVSSFNSKVCLTLCGTSKLQFFYAEILPEFKNRPMLKTVNAICKQIIKVKKSYKISAMCFSSWEFLVCVFAPDTLCLKGLKRTKVDYDVSFENPTAEVGVDPYSERSRQRS